VAGAPGAQPFSGGFVLDNVNTWAKGNWDCPNEEKALAGDTPRAAGQRRVPGEPCLCWASTAQLPARSTRQAAVTVQTSQSTRSVMGARVMTT
jgi:hypothetical protein